MKIFISYSRKDKIYKDRLLSSILKLQKDGISSIWVDERKLKSGDEFDDKIQESINTSDIFLLLLSENFWNSDYIKIHELPVIQERYRKDKIKIIPIILKNTKDLFEYDGINKKLAMPQGKAVVNVKPQTKAFNEVYYSLKELIDSQNIGLNYHTLHLLKEALSTLNPYDDFIKLKFESFEYINSNEYNIIFTKYYENSAKKIFSTHFILNDEIKNLYSELYDSLYFKPKSKYIKIKEKLLEQKEISRNEILDILDTTSDRLFPVCSKIKIPNNYIKTLDIKNLEDIINQNEFNKIHVYGDAGVGKTSTLSSLSILFHESTTILYDSFGAGTYKNIGEKRHLKKSILTQIINELAIHTGLSLHINKEIDLNDLEFEFKQQLQNASRLLQDKNIFIIIDAADNNVEASNYFNEEAFIKELWSIDLPNNVYLIMSSRDGLRKESLCSPSYVKELKLYGFDEDSSISLLKESYEYIKEDLSKKFHDRTKGNPRLQNYIIEECSGDISKLENILNRKDEISLEHIFEDIWDSALSVIQPITKNHLEELICLSRPASLDDFILASNISKTHALKIIDTLSGVILSANNYIGFLDEDFENFLVSKLTELEKIETHKRISNNLFKHINKNEFAARFISFHLEKAKESEKLISLALNSDLSVIKDQIEREDIQKDRISNALRISSDKNDYKSLSKLLYISAELLETNELLNHIVQDEYLDLLSIYTNEENAIELLTKYRKKLKSFNYHCAYLLAKTNPQKAKEYLSFGDIWLKKYLEDEDRQHHDLNAVDIAKRICTLYHLKDKKRLLKSLRFWKLWFFFKVVDELPTEFLKEITTEVQKELYPLLKKRLHPFIRTLLVVKLQKAGHKVETKIVKDVAKSFNLFIDKYPDSHKKLSNNNYHTERFDINKISIDFSVIALQNKVNKKIVLKILSLSSPSNFNNLYDTHSLRYFDDTFLCISLDSALKKKKYNFDKVLNSISKNIKKQYKQDDEKKKKLELINILYPYYELLGKVLVEKLEFNQIKEEWENLKHRNIPYQYYRSDAILKSYQALVLVKILIISNAKLDDIREFVKYTKSIHIKNRISEVFLHNNLFNQAYEIIDYAIEEDLKEKKPAREKIDLFLTYSTLMKDFNKEKSREYFELALEASKGIDENIYSLYRIISSFTNNSLNVLNDNEKIELANKHIQLSENTVPYISETENLVLNDSFKIITKLNPDIALATSIKWHNELIHKIEDTIYLYLKETLQKNLMSIEDVLSMRYLIKEPKIIDIFLIILKKVKSNKILFNKTLEISYDFIRRNLKDEEQNNCLKELLQWLEKESYQSHRMTNKIKEFCEFYEKIEFKSGSSIVTNDSEERDWNEFFNSYDNDIIKALPEFIQLSYRNIENTFEECINRIPYEKREEIVTFLSNPDVSNYYIDSYGEVLALCLLKWKSDPRIKKLSKEISEDFILNHFVIFLDSYRYPKCFDKFSKILSKEEISKIIVCQSAKNINKLGYLNNYEKLFNYMKYLITEEDSKDVLYDLILRYEKRLEIENIDEFENEENIYSYLYKLLGHSDKRIRWKTLHTCKEMIINNPDIIPEFLNQLDNSEGFPFFDDMSFYPIASKESMMILFFRLAFDVPNSLKSYIKKFIDISLDEEFPHIIIRHIAKRIIENIEKVFPNTVSNEIFQKVKLLNEPRSCYLNEDRRYRIGYRERGSNRFDFDSMDTIPYWYESICRVFKVDMTDILEKAETWIIDKWNINTRRDLERINIWGRDDTYSLTNHRHGSLPIVEEPIRHIEYHVMFLVIGVYIKNLSVNISRYSDGDFCEFQEFIDRKFNDYKNWFSEERQIKPLESFLFGKFEKSYDLVRFDELLGINKDKLVLCSSYDVSSNDYSETININSALVSSHTAKALQNALQNTDSHDFKLPFYQEEQFEIDEENFQLQGWLKEISHERREIDKDPYSHMLNTHVEVPCQEILDFTSSKEDIEIENWADEDRGEYDYHITSYGYRINVCKEFIKRYLQSINMDMIIEVQINTSEREQGSRYKDKYSKRSQIYILRQNGHIERYEEDKIAKKGIQIVKKRLPEYSYDTLTKWKLHYEVECNIKNKV
ncbi:MAG: TIR domain-containing protein [Arcobacter sp.]|jgi:hypothetical protein|uniref:toll/interleukin-1 receptor domain-containing protein n=1 Tax=Arcobacter sp. TaxID=1872629 RepID=UPI002A74A010|nr:TIR domain-containing protein [Arcobacter sp.]MDY3205524.1 TIR domain-containing protein [Arcobacter sp.]